VVASGRVVVLLVVGGQTRFGEGAPGTGLVSVGTGFGEASTVALGGGTGEPRGGAPSWRPQWKMRVDIARTRFPADSFAAARVPASTMVMISLVSRAWTW
jgi:hypothetical protein